MNDFNNFYTIDLKLASILTARGIPRRSYDPITCIIEAGGHKQFTFWFDIPDAGNKEKLQVILKEYHAQKNHQGCVVIDDASPVSLMLGVLRIRETFMDEMRKNAHPMIKKQVGDKVVLFGQGASEETKRKLRAQL